MNKLALIVAGVLMLSSVAEVSARHRYGSDCPSCKRCNRGSCGTRDCGVGCEAPRATCGDEGCPVVAGAPRRSADGFTVSDQMEVTEGRYAERPARRAAAVEEVVMEEEVVAPARPMKKARAQKVETTKTMKKTSTRAAAY